MQIRPCRLRFSFWQQYLSVEQECEKAHFAVIDIKLTSVAYLFMMGDFDTVIKEARSNKSDGLSAEI